MCFRCYGDLKFLLTYNEKSESRSLLLSHCRYMYFDRTFYKCLLSSKEVIQISHFDLLPWHKYKQKAKKI